jgi:hypothetical protein
MLLTYQNVFNPPSEIVILSTGLILTFTKRGSEKFIHCNTHRPEIAHGNNELGWL